MLGLSLALAEEVDVQNLPYHQAQHHSVWHHGE